MARGPRRWWSRRPTESTEPTEPGKPADSSADHPSGHVFLSYPHGPDRAYVDRLARHLHARGVPVWYDRDIIVGDEWKRTIPDKIDSCAAFVVLLTPAAAGSPWVAREITQAEQTHRPIFPLLLAGTLPFALSTLQHEDVAGGRMPGPELVARLRELVARGMPRGGPPDAAGIDARRPAVWLIPARMRGSPPGPS